MVQLTGERPVAPFTPWGWAGAPSLTEAACAPASTFAPRPSNLGPNFGRPRYGSQQPQPQQTRPYQNSRATQGNWRDQSRISRAVPPPATENIVRRFENMSVQSGFGPGNRNGVINNNGPMNASHAPAPSRVDRPMPKMTSIGWKLLKTNGPTNATQPGQKRDPKVWLTSTVCVKSPYDKNNFHKGDVIALPFHVPNMCPDVKLTDPNLKITSEGPVYTKRRMFIVFRKTSDRMFCLPLNSYGGQGMAAVKRRTPNLLHEHICLVNEENLDEFQNKHGKYPPLLLVPQLGNRGVDMVTTVHLTAGYTAQYEEDITMVGSLTKESFKLLVGYVGKLEDEAAKSSSAA
ncbi:unnamed protein product [Zymoseptoria tritici ST99CH_3D1]|nr:unnamed protein product [Zymoseptoria tritici ST99CH_3D1]